MKPDSPRRRRNPLARGREGLRLAVMLLATAIIAVVIFGGTDGIVGLFTKGSAPEESRKPVVEVEVKIPHLDRELLRKVKDANSHQRYKEDPEVYEHLLVFANNLVPKVASATLKLMGLTFAPVIEVQENPAKYRAKPLWYEGEVEYLSRPQEIPGMHGASRTTGLLRTDQGHYVRFAVVEPIPESISLGSLARIEGIFFMLFDQRFPIEVEKAPFLVGSALRPAFGGFEPVKTRDLNVLALAKDDTIAQMKEIEPTPLYHLSSYVLNRPENGNWESELPSLTREVARKLIDKDPEYPRGQAYKIFASLYHVRSITAEPNPLGNAWWTDVWVEHPEVGLIMIRIPKKVEGEWKPNDFVVLYGHYLKGHVYETGNPEMRIAEQRGVIERSPDLKGVPFFVANELYRWELVYHPSDQVLRISLAAVAILLVGLLCFLVIRDNRSDKEVMARMLERRRRRRQRTA